MPAPKSGAVFRRPVKTRPANFRDLPRPEQEKWLEEKWTARYERPRDLFTEKREPISRGGFATAREAQRWLNEQLASQDKGTHVRPTRMKLATFLTTEWLPAARRRVKASTLDSFEQITASTSFPGSAPLSFRR